jgi:hypothetical protein
MYIKLESRKKIKEDRIFMLYCCLGTTSPASSSAVFLLQFRNYEESIDTLNLVEREEPLFLL